MAQCKYEKSYKDIETGEEKNYSCKKIAWRANKCKLHHERYLKPNTSEEIKEIFEEEKNNSKMHPNEPLLCIGYNLPTIELAEDKKIDFIIYFIDTKFRNKIDFSKIVFTKPISFNGANFHDEVSFTASTFEQKVDFDNAKILGKLCSFQFTKSSKSITFSYGEIHNATFNQIEFNEADFNHCTFLNKASFYKAKFYKNIIFEEAKFQNDSDFSEAEFMDDVNFNNSRFLDYANFSNVKFCKDSKTRFNGNISNISFLNTKMEGIDFGDKIMWKEIKNSESLMDKMRSKLNWKTNSDYKIYDERKLEKELKKNEKTNINLESIKNAYRSLRENFDLNLRYEIAGEFHVREMELRRRYVEKQNEESIFTVKKSIFWKHFSIYWIYNILAQYGQSYQRPICWTVFLITIATSYFFKNDVEHQVLEKLTYSPFDLLGKALARSLAGIIPFDIVNKPSATADIVLRLALLPVTGTFFIALKRKMERKLRH